MGLILDFLWELRGDLEWPEPIAFTRVDLLNNILWFLDGMEGIDRL